MKQRLLDRSFPNEIDSIQHARSAAAEVSRDRLAADDVELVRLLTSELVTNCVQHGRGPIGVVVEVDDRLLSVSVSDGGAATLTIPTNTPEPGGHGLRLVAALSDGWEQVAGGPTEIRFWLEVPG